MWKKWDRIPKIDEDITKNGSFSIYKCDDIK